MPMASHTAPSPQRALHANVTPSPLLTMNKRGHTRSSSLENSFLSKNTLGLPPTQCGQSGTLKARNEQKRTRTKFGSHNNLDDYTALQLQQQGPMQKQGRLRFQNIRQFFEISKSGTKMSKDAADQAIPAAMTQSLTEATTLVTTKISNNHPNLQQQQRLYQQHLQQQRPAPTKHATGNVKRSSIAIDPTTTNSDQQQMPQQQQQQCQQHKTQQNQQSQEHVNGIGSIHNLRHTIETPDQSVNSILRPIAFKPIPFEPDYSIPNRYCEPYSAAAPSVGNRFGSTPSLAPVQGSNLRFGSTTDLRNGSNISAITNNNGGTSITGGVGVGIGVGGAFGVGTFAGYSSNNYCNSLMARRRGSRSLKINDSMESIRHTLDSDAQSQSSKIAMNSHNTGNSCNNNNSNNLNNINSSNNGSISGSTNNKFLLSKQYEMTPSPSDSGISDLETALKDRDSELSYLRQTMEHNEKDKEAFYGKETQRVKAFYDEQQKEYLLKMKKMEQMLAMQQFQFKQLKLKHTEQVNQLREQFSELKNENEILRSSNTSLKTSERNLKDRVAYIEEQLNGTRQALGNLKAQLEDCEWKVCERNGELALLKTQLKEANVEITLKEHAIVHLKHENANAQNHNLPCLQNNQTNKIIILKDQVILALTNELAKLRKELSDLAISHEYGKEPSGKFLRLRQQLDSLSDICNKKRRQQQNSLDDSNLEVIMNCLKISPPAESCDDDKQQFQSSSAEKRLAEISADIQKFVYGTTQLANLPDVAISISSEKSSNMMKCAQPDKIEETTLDTLIEESANYAQEIAKLRHQLDNVRINFEQEKHQWCDEREKVLRYQKQLQMHYISMYQKLKSLESSID